MTVERFPIEAGHVMFARSIGDPNPFYSDTAYAAASERSLNTVNQDGTRVFSAHATGRVDP